MKRLCRILSIFWLCVFLVGCGTGKEVPTSKETEPTDEIYSQEEISSGAGYTLSRINGRCYIDLHDGNIKKQRNPQSCVVPAMSLEFPDIAQLHTALTEGSLTEEHLEAIRYGFDLKQHGFSVADPDKLYDLTYPKPMELVWVDLQSERYTFHLRSNTDLHTGVQLTVMSETEFNKKLENYDPFKSGVFSYDYKIVPQTDADKTVYEYTTDVGTFHRSLYTVEESGKTLYISECYRIAANNDLLFCSEVSPYEVNVYGIENGAYYTFAISYNDALPSHPGTELIRSFSLTPYTP